MSIEYRPCEEKDAAGSYNSQVRRAVGRRQETRRKTMATDECWKQDGVRVIPATELDPNTAQTPGMDRKGGGPWLASNAGMPPVSCAGCQALQRCLRRQLDKATCTGKRLACALWSHRSTHSNVSTLRASVAPTGALDMGPAPRPMRGASPEPNHGQQFPEKIRPMSEPSVEFVRLQDGRDGDAEQRWQYRGLQRTKERAR
jgi:hypothetical protein